MRWSSQPGEALGKRGFIRHGFAALESRWATRWLLQKLSRIFAKKRTMQTARVQVIATREEEILCCPQLQYGTKANLCNMFAHAPPLGTHRFLRHRNGRAFQRGSHGVVPAVQKGKHGHHGKDFDDFTL